MTLVGSCIGGSRLLYRPGLYLGTTKKKEFLLAGESPGTNHGFFPFLIFFSVKNTSFNKELISIKNFVAVFQINAASTATPNSK